VAAPSGIWTHPPGAGAGPGRASDDRSLRWGG